MQVNDPFLVLVTTLLCRPLINGIKKLLRFVLLPVGALQ